MKFGKAKPLVILGAAFLVAVLAVALRPTPEVKQPEVRPILVDVVEVSSREMTVSVKAQGSVVPHTQTQLSSEVAGRIIEVSSAFTAGGFIKAGDVLLRIDDRNYVTALEQAEANVARAKSALAQEEGAAYVAKREWQQRNNRESISPAARDLALRKPQMQLAKAELESAEAAYKDAKIDLTRTVITAPYDGIVRSRRVDIGQFVKSGANLGEIFSVDTAEIRLAIPENKLSFLNLPDTFRSEINGALPSVLLSRTVDEHTSTWQAKLVRTEGIIDGRSRSLFVVASVSDPYGIYNADVSEPLRVGMFVDAVIEGRNISDVIPLPRNIIRPGNKVWIVDGDNRLQERKVSVVRTDGNEVFVTEGLDNGDKVSLTSVGPVMPGTPVEINSVMRQQGTPQLEAEPENSLAEKEPIDTSGAGIVETQSPNA